MNIRSIKIVFIGVVFLSLLCPIPFNLFAAEKQYKNDIGMEFVLIPAGKFKMGADKNFESAEANELPQHEVLISKPFYLGKYEVSQDQWYKIMGENPSNFKDRRRPVEDVSWNKVQEFIKKLNEIEGNNLYRLPTEAEWEYAARAGSELAFGFGDQPDNLDDYSWHNGNSNGKTHPVGQKKPNSWGLHDMYGNVAEWVEDWYIPDSYKQDQSNLTSGNSANYRINRGGSWNAKPHDCRIAKRNYNEPGGGGRAHFIGFRVLREVETP